MITNKQVINATVDDKKGISGDIRYTVLKGEKGDPGYTPVKGVDYFDGEKGDPGYTPIKGVDYFDGEKGDKGDTGETGATGPKGDKGETGAKGAPGVSPTVATSAISGGHRVTVTDADGSRSFDVMDGATGAKGDKGDKGDPGEVSVAQLDAALATKADIIINSATGSIASFSDGADDLPVNDLVVQIDPVQDLHGYDSPWPAGGGKNLVDIPDSTTEITAQTEIARVMLKAGTYVLSADLKNTGNGTTGIRIGNSYSTPSVSSSDGWKHVSTSPLVVEEEAYFSIFIYGSTSGYATSYRNIMIESGSTATSYAPYENICPISGWTEVGVTRTGVNLFPYKDIESQTQNGVTATVEKSDGIITNIHLQGTATAAFPLSFHLGGEATWNLPKGNYVMYVGGDKPTTASRFNVNIRKDGSTSDIWAESSEKAISLDADTKFGSAYIWIYSGAVLNHNIIPVIVQSGVDTSVKYPITQRQSITIDLGQTVYGGKLDVLSGELVIDRAMVDLGTLNWTYISDSTINFRSYENLGAKPAASAVTVSNAICSALPVIDYTSLSEGIDGVTVIFAQSAQAGRIWARNTSYTDAASFKAAMTGVQLVYELETPITYTLTPTEIRTLLGTNNIWADTGAVEVTYRADTKLYIDNKITQAIANALNA